MYYVVLPPASPGSLGDEAMMIALLNGLSKQASVVDVIAYQPDDIWPCMSKESSLFYLRKLWSKKNKISLLLFSLAIIKYDRLYILGADVLDGKYDERKCLLKIKLLEIAFKAGVGVEFVGFSFNDSPCESCVKALTQLPNEILLKSRDPISLRRLKSFTGRRVKLTADIAFLLEGEETSENVLNVVHWVDQKKQHGRIAVGLNVSQHVFNSEDTNCVNDIVEKFAHIVEKLIRDEKVSIVGIPHDYRGEINDSFLLEKIFKRLPIEVSTHFKLFDEVFSSAEVKGLCSHLDIVFSCRMHLAIAALGSSTPAGCIVYQDKFQGLFEHFGLKHCTINPNEAFDDNNMEGFVFSMLGKREEYKKTISGNIKKVEKLAFDNFIESH